jgi:hypothetical protein
MKISKFAYAKIEVLMKLFEKSENKLHGIRFLRQILLLIQKTGDQKALDFIQKIQQEIFVDLNESWKTFKLDFPEMNVCYSINKYLFLEEDLKETILGDGKSAWDNLQRRVVALFDTYEVMFGQKVILEIQK